jgi:hypothetical protein
MPCWTNLAKSLLSKGRVLSVRLRGRVPDIMHGWQSGLMWLIANQFFVSSNLTPCSKQFAWVRREVIRHFYTVSDTGSSPVSGTKQIHCRLGARVGAHPEETVRFRSWTKRVRFPYSGPILCISSVMAASRIPNPLGQGSSPWGYASFYAWLAQFGRAERCQRSGRRFEPCTPHQF